MGQSRHNDTRCLDDPLHNDTGAMHTFDVFWAAMNEHYPFFALHGVDWEERKEFAPVTDNISDAKLASLLRRATEGLDDGHVLLNMGAKGFYSPSEKPEWLVKTPELNRSVLWDTAISAAEIQVKKTEGISIRYGCHLALNSETARSMISACCAGT